MIRITINGKSKELATTWDDLTIQQAIDLVSIPLPEQITVLTDTAQWLRFGVQYAAQVFTMLSGFSRATVDKTQAADIIAYFNRYLLQFVVDLHSQKPQTYEPTGIKQFSINGVMYKLPETLKVESQTLPMYSATAIEFVESSNVLAVMQELEREGIKQLPLFVAVYCRPDGEKFDEKKVIERAELFKQLPMSVAWEVFFCITLLIQHYSINILKYTKKQMQGQLMQLRLQAWKERNIVHGFTRLLNLALPGRWKRSG